MNKNELKVKYKGLVRQGKDEDAQTVLDLVRNFKKQIVAKSEPSKTFIEEENSKKKIQKEVDKFETIDDLIKIDCIGSKTLKDIKRVAKTIDELKVIISRDLLPLRDDIVLKLKNELNIK